jgi:hypothetical protein
MGSLELFQFETYLHCRVPRINCNECDVKQIKVSWARRSNGFTLMMDYLIVLLVQLMPAKTVVDLILREYGGSQIPHPFWPGYLRNCSKFGTISNEMKRQNDEIQKFTCDKQ